MNAGISGALSLLALAAALPLRAQQTPLGVRDHMLIGAGFDVTFDDEWAYPMAGFHLARLTGRWVAPAVDVAVSSAFVAADIGFGASLQTGDGREA